MPEPEITIRHAVASDATALHDFMVGIVAERLPVLYERAAAPSVDEEREFIERFAGASRSALFVAAIGDRVVGVLDFHGHKRAQAAHGGAFGMSVSAEERGKGVGRALLQALVDWAPAVGLSRLELEVFATNARAIALYGAMGFQLEGTRRGAVVVNGQAVDVLVMSRLLSAA